MCYTERKTQAKVKAPEGDSCCSNGGKVVRSCGSEDGSTQDASGGYCSGGRGDGGSNGSSRSVREEARPSRGGGGGHKWSNIQVEAGAIR